MWLLTRTFGELKILTKASYATLLLVPMLADLWPAVTLAVNQHNRAAQASAERLERATQELVRQEERLRGVVEADVEGNAAPAEFRERVQALGKTLADIQSEAARLLLDIKPRTIESPRLPWSWAVAFFAALFIALGHLVYEAFAPKAVRAQTAQEFVQSRLQEYRDSPTEGKLLRAQDFGVAFPSLARPDGKRNRDDELRIEFEVIERGAEAEYRVMARQQPVVALAALSLFALGLALVFLVIGKQCQAVASAAGWF